MLDKETLRRSLEATFDIPFSVQLSYENREPVFLLAPEDPGKELFSIKISFRNQIRITMDFIPQKYSVNFIRSMGERPEADREMFSSYCTIMQGKGAKVIIKVNGDMIDVSDTTSWPKDWHIFEARVTKMPIVEDGSPDYVSAAEDWGSLMMGMILALTNIVPVKEEEEQQGYSEGYAKRVETNRYERNPLNRKICLAAKGYNCDICGFNFENVYGELGHHFIHVHHITPVSQIEPGYIINPIKDLIPVCPNCHAMLHKSDPPILPEQLKKIYSERKKWITYSFSQSQTLMAAESKGQYGSNKKEGTNLRQQNEKEEQFRIINARD